MTRFLCPDNEWTTLWFGRLTADELDGYLKEKEGPVTVEDDDEVPFRSAFASDLDQWYDHDYLMWSRPPVLRTSRQLADQWVGAGAPLEVADGDMWNTVIALSEHRVVGERERVFAGGKLALAGSWMRPLRTL